MTEEELRREIRYILEDIAEQGYERRFGYNNIENGLNEILTLIREAGWKSPKEKDDQ